MYPRDLQPTPEKSTVKKHRHWQAAIRLEKIGTKVSVERGLKEGFISPQGLELLKSTDRDELYQTSYAFPSNELDAEISKVERKLIHTKFRKGNLDLSFDPRVTNNVSPQLIRYVTSTQAEETKLKAQNQKLISEKMFKPELKLIKDKTNREYSLFQIGI